MTTKRELQLLDEIEDAEHSVTAAKRVALFMGPIVFDEMPSVSDKKRRLRRARRAHRDYILEQVK